MKQNKIFLIVFFTSLTLALFAQQEYPREYFNQEEGWKGRAFAIYLAENEVEKYTNDLTNQKGRWISKLSKKNTWLSWQALNEWDVMYHVIILP